MSAHYLIRLEDNQGSVIETVQDYLGIIDNILVSESRRRNGQLQYIDPYGTTSFNGLQAEALLCELKEAISLVKSKEAVNLLKSLERITRQCSEEPHLFLKFYGD